MSKNETSVEQDTQKLYNEVKEEMEDPYFGIESDKLIAFVDHKKTTWKIIPDGHTRTNRRKLIAISDDFKKKMLSFEKKGTGTRLEREEISEAATKKTLEFGLVGFVYDKWADDAKAGPNILGLLANEVQDFLVEKGSKEGSKHLLMLHKLETLMGSNGLMASQTSTESSDSTDTE